MKRQTVLFWMVTTTTVVWMLIMRPVTPANIIEYEFARTVEKALQIFIDWGLAGVEKAKMSILFDFVFLVLYSWAISLGCKVVVDFVNIPSVTKIGLLLSKVIWIAGACDFVENVSLLIVMHRMSSILLEIAFWMAGIKFTIVIVALLFILVEASIGLVGRVLKK